MILRFHARADLLVNDPARAMADKQPIHRVGRKFIAAKEGQLASYPALEAPHEVDSESRAGQRLVKLCRRDASLWPADEATAAFCDVPFVPVELRDGEWVEKPAAPSAESNEES